MSGRAGVTPGNNLLLNKNVSTIKCAAHNTVTSKVIGMNDGRLRYNAKFGLPPMLACQSKMFMYHIISNASDMPVAPYRKEQIANRVFFTPIHWSMP